MLDLAADTADLCIGTFAGRDLAVFDPYQVLRHIHDASIMRRKNKGCLEASVNIFHQPEYSLACFMIQVRCRLIRQHHFWLRRQGPRDGYSLALPSAELVWQMPCKSGEIYYVEISGHAAAPLCCIQLLELQQRILDIFFGRQNRKKIEGLKYKTNRSPPQFRELIGRLSTHILATYEYFSAGRCIDATDKIEQSGLATSGRTRYRDEGTILDAQRDMFQGLHLLLTKYVILGDILKTDYAHRIGFTTQSGSEPPQERH